MTIEELRAIEAMGFEVPLEDWFRAAEEEEA